ncbi:hypothetical protein EV385_3112 [Krasilnikovia cinnamomea]|uniref:Uncharacterized protein n=1 Tax=Krasilnikovia cinnamomea TaxID=349313 RepID=A0A4Q7ZM19_9ACTN|nr:hypothetical protein [Krasilnikovia cinnamomea]RZU51299.1 hypothetical protein EV385_3112 [Krasilnikovia cinnamomea]
MTFADSPRQKPIFLAIGYALMAACLAALVIANLAVTADGPTRVLLNAVALLPLATLSGAASLWSGRRARRDLALDGRRRRVALLAIAGLTIIAVISGLAGYLMS